MKLKRIFAGMAASAIAMTAIAASSITASADDVVTGNAGISFQTNTTWNYRNCFGSDQGDATQDAAFPNKIVGVQGAANGYDADIEATDVAINGDNTYKISIACSGVIDTDIQAFDDGTSRSGDALKWSMAKNYELDENGQTIDGNVTDIFNLILITTDIECDVNEDGDVAFAEINGQEVDCKDVTLTMGGETYTLDVAPQKTDADYLTFEVINIYNKDNPGLEDVVIPEDGTMDIEFTLTGLGSAEESSSEAPAEESSETPVESSSTADSTPTTTNPTSSVTDTSKTDDTNPDSGATAGIALAGIVLAGAAIVVAKRK